MLRFVQQVWLAIADLVRSRAVLHAEVIRLRHENAVLRRRAAPRRVPLGNGDRLFLVCLYRLWPQLAKLSRLVSPATLIRWHRGGFRAYWRWKSRAKPGRPKIDRALIALIKRLARENPVWGAPRVHGELLKLGFGIAQSTVSMYMPSRKGGDFTAKLADISKEPRARDRRHRHVRRAGDRF